jgi:hypothetical protein
MNAKHTPGPWVLFTGTDGDGTTEGVSIDEESAYWAPILEERDQEGWVICRLTSWDLSDRDRDEVRADMALIAAAPELLAALEDLVSTFDVPMDAQQWANARAAISKATGGA